MSETACRPFSIGRDGTVLGEGAATIVLEEEGQARRRGASIYCALAGAGASSDARHLTQPCAETECAAILAAHADAAVTHATPLLINAHGTGTQLNDRSEAEAFRRVYGDELDFCRVIATKSLHGHLLGAAGAMEFLLGVLALVHGRLPPTANFLGADPQCPVPIVVVEEQHDFKAMMSCSFAFGGLNAALLATLV
jgi:nodulation protein E